MSTDVRVVTFNTAAGNPKIKTVETEFLDLPFYREALEDAPGAPLLALQEVGPGQARALRERARGAPCQVLQKRRPGLGNALVVPARYRVLRARRRYFVLSQLRGTIDGLRWWAKEGHKPNWRQFGELRMWVEARVRDSVTEREFTVLTTHLSVEASLKRRQAEQVVRRARRAARRGPVVLAGDFNVPANPRGRDVEIAAVLGRLTDAGSAQPGRRPNIDYVLTDGFEPVSSKVWMGDSLSLPSSPTAELISDHYAEDDVLRFTVPRGARRGAGQVAFGARATIRRDRRDDMRTALAALAGPGAFATAFPFAQMDGVHFGRLLIIDDEVDPDGVLVPASLVYMSEVDAPLARHLQQLTTIAGPALDAVFSLCEGYPDAPDPASRLTFLEAAYLPAQARYVNTVGRTCRQVLDEAYLREAIQTFLDRRRFDLPADAQGVRLRSSSSSWMSPHWRGRATARRGSRCACGWGRRCTSSPPSRCSWSSPRCWRSCCRSGRSCCATTRRATPRPTFPCPPSTPPSCSRSRTSSPRTSSARSAGSSRGGFGARRSWRC